MRGRFVVVALLFAVPCWLGAVSLPKASPTNEEAYRLDCGETAADTVDPKGNLWLKDEPFSRLGRWGYVGGETLSSTATIAGADSPKLYQTQRVGTAFSSPELGYTLVLPNGHYRVTLHFAEIQYSTVGARVFDVALNGDKVIEHLDLVSRVGPKAVLVLSFDVKISTKILTLSFPSVKAGAPAIAGIEVAVVSVSDDDFLDFIQRSMFGYFWNETGPTLGLINDKVSSWKNQADDMASIASVGWGLSVFSVAAKRYWVTGSEAHARIMEILNTFESTLHHTHGFWYHWVNRVTGERWQTSEVSTVDSAIFIMGALQAGEAFRREYPDIAAKADQLYRRMEWDWYTGRGPASKAPFLSMGWFPEEGAYPAPGGGSFYPWWWDSFMESVFVDLMALASPTHPIGKDAWTKMARPRYSYGGYSVIDSPQQALFIHQFPHFYYDFRGIRDDFANYFDNSVSATHMNRLTCVNNPTLYEPHRWGLTACDVTMASRGIYTYHVDGSKPSGVNSGDVAPSAAIASIQFTPRESIDAARYMYFQYKHNIWGRYGFTDSFNVSSGFVSDYTVGLNNGAAILAIENFRSGLVRDSFMSSRYARAGLKKAGFVKEKKALKKKRLRD